MDLNGEKLMESFAEISWSGGSATWNAIIKIVHTILTKTPEEVFPDAWKVTTQTLLPWFVGAGLALVNLFFLIGFIRQNMNLKENLTLEVYVEMGIRVIIANTICKNILVIIKDFLKLSIFATKFVVGKNVIKIINPEFDTGTLLFYMFIGVMYFVVSIVCSVIVLLTVLKRILYINFSVVGGPIGIACIAGGRGIANSGYAWIKTFLTYCFQVVAIALILRIGTLMASGFSKVLLSQVSDSGIFDGFFGGLNNLVVMVFITAAIKSSDDLIKRMFDLR